MPKLGARDSDSRRNSRAGRDAQTGRPAAGMRPARIHAGDQRGHGARAGGRRLRGDRAARSALLRGSDGARRRGNARARPGPARDRRFRTCRRSTSSSPMPAAADRTSASTATSCATIPSTPNARHDSRPSAKISPSFWRNWSPAHARKPLNMRVAYHDSCHLQHAQRVRTQPRAQLSAIPGVEMLELPEADAVLRLGGHLQPGPAGHSRRAGRPQGATHYRGQSPTSSPPAISDACCKSPRRWNARGKRRRCCTPSS